MRRWCNAFLLLFLVYVLCSILLSDCVCTSYNILGLRVEINSFERSLGVQASFRIQSLSFWYCTRYRRFKFRPQHATSLKKRLWLKYFPVIFAEFLRKSFLHKTSSDFHKFLSVETPVCKNTRSNSYKTIITISKKWHETKTCWH